MTKKLMRGLVPVMVLSAAVALFTGCGSKEAPADATQAGGSKGNRSCRIHSSI